MKYWILTILLVFAVLNTQQVSAQEIFPSQLSKIDVDNMSDEQISSYWEKAKGQGYSLDQLEVIAASKGMSASQVSKLRQRISALRFQNTSSVVESSSDNDISSIDKFGLEGKTSDKIEKSSLFGFDFFSNPNISFTPNLNLATPTTYQLGPGDEILIDVWGAAENNYRKQVDREGAIRIENIGPVYVSGLSIGKAKEKIISYLKKIYSGIGASGSSYNKVYADVSLVGVRTVQVNIIGEVKVPGTYSLSALSTVLNALYAAGGPTEKGTFRTIKVIRGGQNIGEFDIYNYLINGSEKGNVMLQDQDVIIVQPYGSKVSVTGNVKRPGLFELKQGETIKDLINYFSGFTANAYQERLLVNRVDGKQKKVSEIKLSEQLDFMLKDGDNISVGAVLNRFENRVSIDGAIYRPGNYELSNELTLFELIEKAGGVKDNVFLTRGILYRTLDDINKELISFSVKEIIQGSSNISLKREDSIQIFSTQNLKEKEVISIDGAVNSPQTIGFIEKVQIEDLIAIAGGFNSGADVDVIDISRRVPEGGFEIISKNIKRSSSANLQIDENEPFYLEPFDKVSVRYKKGFTVQKNVKIRGEVFYPGNYSIIQKDERISDLVKKAGGFSPFAYLEGASLFRNVVYTDQKGQIKMLEELSSRDSITDLELGKKEFKIGIDLEKIMSLKGQKSKIDLILQEGDVLLIPSEKQTVEVRGAILAPSLIRYDKTTSLKDYINSSGGFSENAKKRKAYVIYSNGDIAATKNFLFFKSYPKMQPGALILVPEKSENKHRMSATEILGITSGISTLGILIKTLLIK